MTNQNRRLTMNANQAKYPQLRFKGFTDPWEQRKLGDLGLNISDGDWIEKQHIFENGQYRIIQTGNIGVDEYLDKPQNAKYFRQEDFNQLKANEIFPGDIVVCRLADPAGRAVILPNIGKQMVTSVDVAILRPSSRISFRFLVSQLNNPRNLKQVQIMASGSTRTRISRKNLEREIIQLPNINEQKKIGSFFSILNSTIALHQRKLAKLKELKQGYLQKLFPKNGSKFPQLRFAGFADAWEQRKLGEVAEIKTGSRNHQDSVDNGKYPFFVRSEKVERLNEYDFDTKAILVPGDGRIGEIFHYYDGKFALHQRVYKVDNFKEVNPLYLLNLFKYKFKKHALRLNAQGTVPSLRLPMFTNWNILIPNLNEQQKIGLFFQQLDSLIALHQRKLEKLQELKKGYLQKMFC